MFQQILIVWDGSEVARAALDVAIDLTRRYEAELVAVSVAYSPVHAETAADRRETVAAAREYLAQSFAEVSDRALRAGVPISHEIIDGDEPDKVLAELARRRGFDLIVCGHHPQRRVGRLLLKGAAEQLIQGAIPVLVVGEAGD